MSLPTRNIILTALALSFFHHSFGQKSDQNDSSQLPVKNAYVLGFFGDASTISLNYERNYRPNPYMLLTAKTGLGYRIETAFWAFVPGGWSFYTLPMHLSICLGYQKHFLEIGRGYTWDLFPKNNQYYIERPDEKTFFVYNILGYRFQPFDKKKYQIRIYALYERKVVGHDYRMVPIGISVGRLF